MNQDHAFAIVPDPEEDAYLALGVPDAATGRLLHVAFSRLLGEARGKRGIAYNTCAAIAGIGRLEFRRADGSVEAAPAPQLPSNGWPQGAAVFSRLGSTPRDLDHAWDTAHAMDGHHATLPLDTVLAFFPAELWPVCAELLCWGPAEACERLERFARLEALREVKPTRARPQGGTLSASSVDFLLKGGRRLFRVLSDLRLRGYPAAVLEGWSVLPPPITAKDLGAVDAHTDRTAPPLLLVRQTLKALTAEIERRSRTRQGATRLKRLLRKRLLLALLVVTGMRIGALAALCVVDYDPAHRFPDGTIGPALRIFPGKSIDGREARWKALPTEVAAWLEHYLAFLGIGNVPNASLWPSDRTRGATNMHATSLSALLAGQSTRPYPLVPLLPRAGVAEYGYSAHTLRHLVEQLAYDVGHDCLQDRPDARAFITPQVLTDALLDREMSSDHLGYKDLDTPEGRERWARVAGLGLWEYLWGDKGARHAPDRERIERALAVRDELRAEQSAVHARVRQLRSRRRGLERQGEHSQGLGTEDLVRVLLQLSALAGALDDEHEEAERVQRDLHAAELELQEARRTLVPLPDDAPDPEELDIDADELKPAERIEPARDWLTPAEAAFAFGVSEATMRRWMRGLLPHPERDPRNPWQPDETDTVVERRGPRKQRLIISRLDRSRIAPEVMRVINEMLTRQPS